MTDSCIFCRIASGQIPATIIAQNEHAIAFRDLDPKAPVHALVIPRRHVASIAEALDPGELGAVMLLVAAVARLEGVSDSGFRTVINTGEDGGQSVFHLHAHVLGGRPMSWPPG
ncbi:MAG TPA: histidine triad nucleotide-binding protein [Gemmatimonas sp.]|nr:histidine triad nucleotide-binding protein [Gemmatimonas sp.]